MSEPGIPNEIIQREAAEDQVHFFDVFNLGTRYPDGEIHENLRSFF
jgi:hypothetical protein